MLLYLKVGLNYCMCLAFFINLLELKNLNDLMTILEKKIYLISHHLYA